MSISKKELKAAKKLAEANDKLAKGVPSIKALKLKENLDFELHPVFAQYDPSAIFLLVGEVGHSRHYIISRLKTGETLPGMYHLDCFEEAGDDDL